MLFATAHPALRRSVYSPAGRTLERFLNEAVVPPQRPAAQYKQDDTSFQLTMDVPGLSREQLAILIDGAQVRIESREGAPRQYRAAYELPLDIDAAASEARLENGVLTVKLAKKVPAITTTEITIQ